MFGSLISNTGALILKLFSRSISNSLLFTNISLVSVSPSVNLCILIAIILSFSPCEIFLPLILVTELGLFEDPNLRFKASILIVSLILPILIKLF